jgi:hypothetical protein
VHTRAAQSKDRERRKLGTSLLTRRTFQKVGKGGRREQTVAGAHREYVPVSPSNIL